MHFQTKEAADLVGLERWQVQSFAKQGFIKPAVSARGAGTRRAYDLLGLVQLNLLKRLTDDGFDLRTIRSIFSGLFDIPALNSSDDDDQTVTIHNWFRDRVLITSRQFSLRKMIKRERLTSVMNELLSEFAGLYIIDLGAIIGQLLMRIRELQTIEMRSVTE